MNIYNLYYTYDRMDRLFILFNLRDACYYLRYYY